MKPGFGLTSEDRERHRAGFCGSHFEKLESHGIGGSGRFVIDLGTGTGSLARGVALRGCRSFGIAPAQGRLQPARELDARAGVEVDARVAQTEGTGLAGAVFDVVSRVAIPLLGIFLAACAGGFLVPVADDPLAAHSARNIELLRMIEQEGAALDEVREVDLFFYADSQSCARQIAMQLESVGFAAQVVAPDATVGQWAALSQARISAREAGSRGFTERMLRVAAGCGGEYDGWGTQL